jgi:hypothetical protein
MCSIPHSPPRARKRTGDALSGLSLPDSCSEIPKPCMKVLPLWTSTARDVPLGGNLLEEGVRLGPLRGHQRGAQARRLDALVE